MLKKKLEKCQEVVALDASIVREILNPHDYQVNFNYSLAHATVQQGKATLPHRFKTASEVYHILRGRGTIHIGEQSADVGPGDTIYVPPMAVQYIENKGQEKLEFLCIVYPSWRPDAEELV